MRAAPLLLLGAALLSCYWFALRPSQLRWGATPGEVARPLPGDGLVTEPNLLATRAVTIEGRPADIWPWIVQIGYGRAGFYGYDLIENLGSRSGIRSAANLVPGLQSLKPGDRVYMSRLAYLRIDSMSPNRFLIWASDEKPPHGAFTFALFPLDEKRTRLIVRARLRYHWTGRLLPLDLFTEFGDHVAVPRMLLGVRDRVEGRASRPLAWQGLEIAVWLAGMAELAFAAVLLCVRRQWRRPWIAGLAAGLALLFALYAHQPVWMCAILQIPVLAILVWAV